MALERAAGPHARRRARVHRLGGFLSLYPQRPAVLVPTFVGAYAGSDEKLPIAHMAFADPGAREAKELMVRLLREKVAYEANVFPDNNFIVSASVFPYFYGLVGDRNPRQPPKADARSEYSPLAVDTSPSSRRKARSPSTGCANCWAAISRRQLWIARWTNCGPSCASPVSITSRRGRVLGCAVSLVARCGERGHARFGGGSR